MSTSGSSLALSQAISAWRELLGDEYVVTALEPRQEFETATFPTSSTIPAIIRPANRAELQECLRIANRFQTPVYAISRGRNWGYGSRVPPQTGCVVIALDRLNRILDFDEQLAYITVEPGVTFADVNRHLREHGSDLVLNSPGSTAEASVIGNAVERGISGGLHGERAEQICNLEVVLADGSLIQTGLGRFPNADGANVFRHAPGPVLDGLFTQSNLGIVTRLTLWLTPAPKFFQYFSFAIRNERRLAELVDALQTIKRERLIETNIGLYNRFKLLTYLTRHPGGSDERLRLEELPAGDVATLKSCVWFGEAAITAPNGEIGRALQKLLRARLAPKTDQLSFAPAAGGNGLIGPDLLTSLSSVYWRKDSVPNEELDPDRDRCGLIWICPVAAFRGESISRCVSLITEGLRRFPFEPIIGVQFHSLRAARVIASIVYDRDTPGHDEKALAVHDQLLRTLNENGFVSYRLTTLAMDTPVTDSYGRLIKKIRGLIDPFAILAPGRYE